VREREGVVPRGQAALLREVQRGESVMVKRGATLVLVAALGALLAGLLACSVGPRARAVSPATAADQPAGAPPGAQTMPDDPRAEIEELWQRVETERGRLGLTAAPAHQGAAPEATPMTTVPRSSDPSCQPAKTERCTSSCTLSDSICSNAQRICELATQLPADDWARGKCVQATRTCESAHASCCGCR
jgi:hypothetical protein